MFSLPRSVREVFLATALREKGVLAYPGIGDLHLRDRQVEFTVNNDKQSHAMKLGEGGEAFFVFETTDEIPESLQTSPIVSAATSPQGLVQDNAPSSMLQEPDFLDIGLVDTNDPKSGRTSRARPGMAEDHRAQSDFGI